MDVTDKVSSTSDKIKAAIEGEDYESNVMYPEFIEQAKNDSNQKAVKTFELALGAEKAHAELYKKALDDLDATGDLKAESFRLCTVCGYIELDYAPERCPVCGAKVSAFKQH